MAPPRTVMRQTDDTVSMGLQQLVRTEKEYVKMLESITTQVAVRLRFCGPRQSCPLLDEVLGYMHQLAAFHTFYTNKLQLLLDDSTSTMTQIEVVLEDFLMVVRVVYASLHAQRTQYKSALDALLRLKNDDGATIVREYLQTHNITSLQFVTLSVNHMYELLEHADIILGSTSFTQTCEATKHYVLTKERDAADESTLIDIQTKLRGTPLEMDLWGRKLLCQTVVTLARTSSEERGLEIDQLIQPVHNVYCLDDGTVLFIEQDTSKASQPVGLCINLKKDAVFLETVPRSIGDTSRPAAMVLAGPSSSLLVACQPEASVTDFYGLVDCVTTLLAYNDSRTQQLKGGRSVTDLEVPDDLKTMLVSSNPPLVVLPCFHDDDLPGMFWMHDVTKDTWKFVELVQFGSWMLIFAVSGWRRHHLLHRIDLSTSSASISEAPRSHENWGLWITSEPDSKGIEVVSERRTRIDFWYDQISKCIEATATERKKLEAQATKAAKAAAEAEAQAAAKAVADAAAKVVPSTVPDGTVVKDSSADEFINVRAKKRQRNTTSVSSANEASSVDPGEARASDSNDVKLTSGRKRRSTKTASVDDAVAVAQRALFGDVDANKSTEPTATPPPKAASKRQRTPPVKTPKQRWVRRKTDDPDDHELVPTQPGDIGTGSEASVDEPAGEPSAEGDTSSKPTDSIRIIFTGIEPTPKTFKKINAIPGAVYEENIELATHVVAPKNTLKRTVKLLCGISTCEHILDERWLDESARVHTAVYERQYCLKDAKAEAKWGFDLVKTMYDTPKDQRRRLFHGHRFFITPHKSILPPVHDLVKIVEQAGGTIVTSGTPQEGDLVITSEAAMATAAVSKIVSKCDHVYTPELILSSILQQNLDTNLHRLNPATSKTPPRSRSSRS